MAAIENRKYTVNLSTEFVNYYNSIINNGGMTGEPVLAVKITISGVSMILSCYINNFGILLPDFPTGTFISATFLTEEEGDNIFLTGELEIVYNFGTAERVISNFDIEILGITASDFTNS